MSLVKHAQTELEKAGLFSKDSDYDGMLGLAALEMIKLFSNQGHSGGSAGMVTFIVNRLMKYKPLTPLTGKEDEWCEVSKGLFQNKRYSSVFKEGGRAHDNDATVNEDPKGGRWSYSGKDEITFPYMPPDKPRVIKCDDDLNPLKECI